MQAGAPERQFRASIAVPVNEAPPPRQVASGLPAGAVILTETPAQTNPLSACKDRGLTRITLRQMLVIMLALSLGPGCGEGGRENAATSTTSSTVSGAARAAFSRAEVDRLRVRGGIQDQTLYDGGVAICQVAGRSQEGLDQAVAELVASKTPEVRDNLLTNRQRGRIEAVSTKQGRYLSDPRSLLVKRWYRKRPGRSAARDWSSQLPGLGDL